jgi:hypothetical protein
MTQPPARLEAAIRHPAGACGQLACAGWPTGQRRGLRAAEPDPQSELDQAAHRDQQRPPPCLPP